MATTAPSSKPDGVFCIQCGYDLRGHEGDPRRCPECGTVNAASTTAGVWQRRKARRHVAAGLLLSFLLLSLLNAASWIFPPPVQMNLTYRVYFFTLVEIGPFAMLCDDGFNPAWAVANAVGVAGLIVAALAWPWYRPLVVLAHLAMPWWFLQGCSVAGLAFT